VVQLIVNAAISSAMACTRSDHRYLAARWPPFSGQ